MSQDISNILNEWEYEEGKNIRIIHTDSGRDVIQVRETMGISQCELDGRPDGKNIPCFSTFLELILSREKKEKCSFYLSCEDIKNLESENKLFYYRYLLCFQINDYARVVRDTEHNLAICRIIDLYCDSKDVRTNVLQYKPFLVKMNAISRAMISLQKNIKILAKQILESAVITLRSMPEINSSVFILEKSRSIDYLESAIKHLDAEKKCFTVDVLLRELDSAVALENYEKAAELRDKIKELSKRTE